MKIYGYNGQGLPIEESEPLELAEITLDATPSELRNIAKFLNSAAETMAIMGSDYSHEHLADKQPEFKSSPHFVVFNSAIASQTP